MPKGKIIGFLIIAFWIVMMLLLLKKEWHSEIKPNQNIDSSLLDSTSAPYWMGVYLKGKRIGYTVNQTTFNNEDGQKTYIITSRSKLKLNLLNTIQNVSITTKVITDIHFTLKSFEFKMISDVHTIEAKGTMHNNILSLEINTSGKKEKNQIKLEKPPTLPITIGPFLASSKLEKGKKYHIEIFDPLTFSYNKSEIEILGNEKVVIMGKEENSVKVRMTYRGFDAFAWINEKGETIKESSANMMSIRESKESAMNLEESENTDDILFSYIVPSNIEIKEPSKIKNIKLRLKNIDIQGLTLQSDRQKLLDTSSITLEIQYLTPDLILPLDSLQNKFRSSEFLLSSMFIQSDDERIKKKALEIIGNERNPWLMALKIEGWINKNIKKKMTVSIPSAIDVLNTLEGDCNEHTTLYVALCRAVGIPAKISVGIVYMNGGFFYHAWPEVYVGNWIPIDPTFGQQIADVTHIKLLEGDISKQIELMKVIGKLEVEVLEIDGVKY